MILIVGGGLAGLSAAWHLRSESFRLFEKDSLCGGLAKSKTIRNFTFDLSGHWLHINDQYLYRFIETLLPNTLEGHKRKAFIHFDGVYTEYPFQVNTYGLPRHVVQECVVGFIEAWAKSRKASPNRTSTRNLSFEQWIYQTFGDGIAKHFMIPYNSKLYRLPLSCISSDWLSWSIPRPTINDVIAGAIGLNSANFGYNQEFLYPRTGGIEILANSIASQVRDNVFCNTEVMSIDLRERSVLLINGQKLKYDALINTMPLNLFLQRCVKPAAWIREVPKFLKYVSVYCINLGIARRELGDGMHWFYVPKKEIPFYRVGFYSNVAASSAPTGCSSLYAEVSALPHESLDTRVLYNKIVQAGRAMGIIGNRAEVVVHDIELIPCAYVIHDEYRARQLPRVFRYLERQGVYCAGRYGKWEYGSMSSAILQGRDVVKRITNFRGSSKSIKKD